MINNLTELMLSAARKAGAEIMRHYADGVDIERKGDGSPVTIADQNAEDIIIGVLNSTGIPLLGEESVAAGQIPSLGSRFFVVDPLDGTKEFIKRNGEFTVNIALVEDGVPVAGVVTAPALGLEFVADETGAYSIVQDKDGSSEFIRLQTRPDGPRKVVASRSHGHAALAALCQELNIVENISVGSSLKLCLVAKGDALLYPRFTPTCEWDIAAGQAILLRAGGAVLTMDGAPLKYGKAEVEFYNPFFVAAANEDVAKKAACLMENLVS
ncbi:3'(2'),5'-bisphosphate nucleotidase CysQ [Maritalea porphyrae]|uniref:3'(2'),5'-bisphosphate nucleotidase CysQ n=1 Tax=Maritalea porphyrae TaxID=880732 RepID=UPI0022B06232|nr:3'(2'),5'-bisphosphate nucleotidase CysQ [Maritalea porphyrae]MCZ4271007.1 3'(2'),5'-bisphosphate nucleotidase CysQ [Maritalea porphyrae]